MSRNLDAAGEPLTVAQAASEMVHAQFALDLELVDQAESMGQGKAVLEIRTNPDGHLSARTSALWGLHALACLRM